MVLRRDKVVNGTRRARHVRIRSGTAVFGNTISIKMAANRRRENGGVIIALGPSSGSEDQLQVYGKWGGNLVFHVSDVETGDPSGRD